MGLRDDDPWRKKRKEREDEEERKKDYGSDFDNEESTRFLINKAERKSTPGSLEASTEKLLELMKRAEPMIEQVNTLYRQYLSGAEKRPPVERRMHLDQLMVTILAMGKPTSGIQFRASTLINHYNVYKEKWEKLLKAKESGLKK